MIPLHEYVQRRIAHTEPWQYARFADRLCLNQWRKVARCGAHVPLILAFFDTHNVSLLAHYKAPPKRRCRQVESHGGAGARARTRGHAFDN